mgnify:CR=1 FL=1
MPIIRETTTNELAVPWACSGESASAASLTGASARPRDTRLARAAAAAWGAGFTALSFLPAVLLMMTGFTRIVIVLSLMRQALGTQAAPPNQVIVGLSLFLTFFVMEPALSQAWANGIVPMMQGQIAELDGLRAAASPFHHFMIANIRPDDLALFQHIAKLPDAPPSADTAPPPATAAASTGTSCW